MIKAFAGWGRGWLICVTFLTVLTLVVMGGCKSKETTDSSGLDAKKATDLKAEEAPSVDWKAAEKEAAEPEKKKIRMIAIEIFQPRETQEIDDTETENGDLWQEVFASVADDFCTKTDRFEDIELFKDKCVLSTPFVSEKQFNEFNLKAGEIFKVEGTDKQYQVIRGVAESAVVNGSDGGWYAAEFSPCSALGHSISDCDGQTDKIVKVKDLSPESGKEIVKSETKPENERDLDDLLDLALDEECKVTHCKKWKGFEDNGLECDTDKIVNAGYVLGDIVYRYGVVIRAKAGGACVYRGEKWKNCFLSKKAYLDFVQSKKDGCGLKPDKECLYDSEKCNIDEED